MHFQCKFFWKYRENLSTTERTVTVTSFSWVVHHKYTWLHRKIIIAYK